MTLDADRSQVYAAEEAAFGGTTLDSITRFEHLERLALQAMSLPMLAGFGFGAELRSVADHDA